MVGADRRRGAVFLAAVLLSYGVSCHLGCCAAGGVSGPAHASPLRVGCFARAAGEHVQVEEYFRRVPCLHAMLVSIDVQDFEPCKLNLPDRIR